MENNSKEVEVLVVRKELYDTLKLENERLRELLNPIIDCYGLGLSPDKFAAQVGPFILDARAALAEKKGETDAS